MKTLTLHEYQIDAVEWILDHHFCGVFLNPGLGKTAIVLTALKYLLDEELIDKVLIVAPLRVTYMVWPYEVKKWTQFQHLSISILHGNNKIHRLTENCEIYVINPEGLAWFLKHKHVIKGKWALVVDESSSFKNASSQRFKFIKSILDLFYRRIILTGTPAPNGLINLWSQMYILDKGARLESSMLRFRSKYYSRASYPASYYSFMLREKSEKKIYEAIDDIVMHRSNDVLDLEEKVNDYIRVQLPSAAMKMYNTMKSDFIVQLQNDEKTSSAIALNSAVMTGKLKQIANGCIYDENHESVFIHSEKTSALLQLIDELEGKPVLILYEYDHELEKIKEKFFSSYKYSVINGKTPLHLQEIALDLWNKGQLPILIMHPSTGGHGLNLQESGCCDVVWYSLPFDLELYLQANARVHRQGAKGTVVIHHIIAQDTIDNRILRVLEKKENVQSALLEYLQYKHVNV